MENALFFGQDYLDEILENVQDGIYITDSEANTVYINHRYEMISGLVKTEMLGRNMKDLVAEGVISVSGTLSVLENKETITIQQSFRTGRRAVITSSPIYADAQKKDHIILVVTIVREITEIYSIRREVQRLTEQNRQYANEIERLNHEINGDAPMVAVSASSVKLQRFAERISMVDTPILISGEAGVGKEELARYIHTRSGRRSYPFVRIDWTMISQEDPVKYLFGYEDPKTNDVITGVLEHADGGTVFVSELTEMPVSVRGYFVSLLHGDDCVMRDGIVRKFNIRFIFASACSYDELSKDKQTGGELLQCLAVFPVEILPLRKRRDDIVPLLDHFLQQYNRKTGEQKRFSKACYKRLQAYSWPENVRELRILVQRAVIVSTGEQIEETDLLLEEEGSSGKTDGIVIRPESEADGPEFRIHKECSDLKLESARLEAYYMNLAFERHKNIRDAAASLGIDSSTFVRKRQRYKNMGLMKEEVC